MRKKTLICSAAVAGTTLFGSVACAAASSQAAFVPEPLVFETPAENDRGAMILGNGEVGALAWVSADGTLHTVLQNSDSWNEAGRHVKTGAINYETGCAVDAGTYRQELSLARGEFEASWKSGGKPVAVRYRVQYGTDSIAVCEVDGAPKAEAKVVNWRLYPGGSKEFGVGEYELGIRFCEGQFQKNVKNMKFTISADRIVEGGWCHVNRNETVADLMKVYDYYQATGDLGKPDLLSDRAFGGVTRKFTGATGVLFLSAITCYHPCKDEAEWLRRTNEMLDRDGWTIDREEAKRAEHVAAWAKFWDRSHIAVMPSVGRSPRDRRKAYTFPYNEKLPVSYGKDSTGGTEFKGSLKVDPKSRIGKDGLFFSAVFNAQDVKRNQRLIDNITPGGANGSLVDILGGRLRLLVAKKMIFHPTKLKAGKDVSVQVSVSSLGEVEMILDGVVHKDVLARNLASPATCAAVTRAYAAQRYTGACAGLGRLPIRFNGSLFTTEEKGDPDYRRWGNGYWWQNTRLPYYPMFVAGDLDMLQPLFRMYLGFLDFNMKRTRKYLGHGGAYFPECVQPWGDHFMGSYGPECAWKDRKDKLQHHPCHKYEWVGQLELSLMLLDHQAYTQNTAWFRKNALPSIREYVRYFDEHYKLDDKGRYHMYPAQAVETWQDCTNPMPEIAGVTRVTDLLLALPDEALEPGDRELFAKIRSRIPDLPTRKIGDDVIFAPGARFDRHRNVETPELYCVFPFRLCSFEKPNAAIGLRTYPVRFHKHYRGWAQDELNAAYLGLADEAAEHLANRVLHNSARGFRWPAYWGPNFDWRPDQCAGGNIQNILQSMLLQHDGDKIFLLPAWPKDWNCDFKLHAPKNTTVEGRVVNGELKDLVVTPAARLADVVRCNSK